MGKNLSILTAIKYEWTFMFTKPEILDLSDKEVVISCRMYVYSTQNNLSQRTFQDGRFTLV
ncbi:hypothetical protein CR51_36480 [Caballeronia megalochromosomata]|nr:hypothetical protein CR51_36480 [Caballeronia megalochromosomata]